jgi:hypothetical protein
MCALTKDELIAQLQKEVRILLHLAGKIDRSTLDYRPTPKQRSTIELLRYLMGMGPILVRSIKSGSFDVEAWQAMTAKANAADFDQVLAMSRPGVRVREPACVVDGGGFPRVDRVVRAHGNARGVAARARAQWMRRVPHAAVLLPEVMRPRGAEYVEPVAGGGCGGAHLINPGY